MKQKKLSVSKQSLIAESWRRGLLSWKLYKHQRQIYDAVWSAIKDDGVLKYVINCSRRFGKTTILCLVSIEYAIRNPNTHIRFASKTSISLRKSVFPIMKMLLADCPQDQLPAFRTMDSMFVFPNGSQIHFAGTDNGHAENLRGTVSHLNIVDEAGSMDDLQYIVKSILTPQTLTVKGTTILASTPSVTPDHDYYYIYRECLEDGCVSEFTIYDNKSIDEETLKIYMKEAGGEDSTTFKREYLVKFITDSEQSIIPEWDTDFEREVQRDDYYRYYHKYTCLDLGVRDYTAGIFGYYDFRTGQLIIEDEYTINGPEMTTDILAADIRKKETEIWGELKPLRRIADNNNLMLLQDLTRLHNLPFSPTTKTTLEAMVNQVRVMIKEGRILIHPRCVQTIGCVKYGVWARGNGKMAFGRSKKYGHYDHLAALVYLVRGIDTNTNPIPKLYKVSEDTHWVNPEMKQDLSNNARTLSGLFKR